MARLTPVLLLWALAGTALAGPLTEPVTSLLDGIEHAPTAAEFAALGDGVDTELLAIAADASAPTSRRGRALSALAFYPTQDVRTALEQVLGEEQGKSLLRRKAAGSLGAGFGDDATSVLEAALSDDDPQLRIAVVHALGAIDTDTARAALSARRGVESQSAVVEAIDQALKETP